MLCVTGVKDNKRKRETLRAQCWRESWEEACAKNNMLVRRPREFLGYLKEKRLHTQVQLYHQTPGLLLFWEEGSLFHFHHFDYNANKCLIKCNSFSLRGSQRWKCLHIKPKNSNRMIFSWNYVSKSCLPWCSISVRYALGTKLFLCRALFVCLLFVSLNKINVWKKSQNKCRSFLRNVQIFRLFSWL